MSGQIQLYEGKVTKTERTRDDRWVLIHVKGQQKPVAFNTASFVSDAPHIGDKISVEASEGNIWFFGQHRTLVVTQDEVVFPIQTLANYTPSRNDMVCNLILTWLQTHPQISSDDIIEDAMRKVRKGTDGRFIGHGFRILSKEKKIHKVGYRKSIRVEVNHGRDQAVWELTLK